MKILISNDDGYLAPGIIALAATMDKIAEITVIAPDRNRSGASNSLTLEMPMRATTMENGFIKVDGTPTDCVHLALTGLLETEPDIVVSGINAGANLGDYVLYSGTVAAAMEGRHLGHPAIAISVPGAKPQYFETAAKVAELLVLQLQERPLEANVILNVNVPDLPYTELKGWQSTRLGNRHKAEPVVKSQDPRGRPIYWVGPPGPEQDAGPGTDFYAVYNGYVSVTPIHGDLTKQEMVDPTAQWLAAITESSP